MTELTIFQKNRLTSQEIPSRIDGIVRVWALRLKQTAYPVKLSVVC
jgi:hypothetical protein